MSLSKSTAVECFDSEMQTLFYQRTILALWLGVFFFLLFSALDFFVCREKFLLFLMYRLALAAVVLTVIGLLRFETVRPYTPLLMYLSLLLGSFTISMMAGWLGGFASGYYVGILLIIAGAFSVLPINTMQALFTGFSMYLVYVLTVMGKGEPGAEAVTHAVNDSFFFFAIVAATAVQCFEDIRSRQRTYQSKNKVKKLQQELTIYTDNLEEVVRRRMVQIEESDLQFKELYENIFDLVVLVNEQGDIRRTNTRFSQVFGMEGQELTGASFFDFIPPQVRKGVLPEILGHLGRGEDILSKQFQLQALSGDVLDVEASGKWVVMPDGLRNCQLVIRDITILKKMEKKVLESHRLIDNSRRGAILGLAKLAEYRDDDTGAHLERIREYTLILAGELANNPLLKQSITDAFMEDIYISSVLHDIGKVGIADSILLKPDKLTAEEFEQMKKHCEFGGRALAEAERDSGHQSFLGMGQEIAWFHHEKWDGSGYPKGLAGIDIPLSARIVALADVYDAMTSRRCYKPAMSHEQVREFIIRESGRHFDPSIVNVFLSREQAFKKTRMESLLN
ncbi:MAG: HD domain-containing protein [Desulfobulbaceae bacterium]|nr:HD domain-containing protein [Desulfobulbaceae bacterium]